jgi:hypothetical protein
VSVACTPSSHPLPLPKTLNRSRNVSILTTAPYEGELVLQSEPDLLSGASLTLNSFVSHTFQVRELPNRATSVCTGEENQCHVGSFTVNSHENQGELSTFTLCIRIFSFLSIYSLHIVSK